MSKGTKVAALVAVLTVIVLVAFGAWQAHQENAKKAVAREAAAATMRLATSKARSLLSSAQEGSSLAAYESRVTTTMAALSELTGTLAASGVYGDPDYTNAANAYMSGVERFTRSLAHVTFAEAKYHDGGTPSAKSVQGSALLGAAFGQAFAFLGAAAAREEAEREAKEQLVKAMDAAIQAATTLSGAAARAAKFAGADGLFDPPGLTELTSKLREAQRGLGPEPAQPSKASPAPPATPASPIADPCAADLAITVNQLACERHNYSQADAQLNTEYSAAMKRLPDERQQALRAEQRAWLAARDPGCKKEIERGGDIQPDGSAWPVAMLGCQRERTEQRTKELTAIR